MSSFFCVTLVTNLFDSQPYSDRTQFSKDVLLPQPKVGYNANNDVCRRTWLRARKGLAHSLSTISSQIPQTN